MTVDSPPAAPTRRSRARLLLVVGALVAVVATTMVATTDRQSGRSGRLDDLVTAEGLSAQHRSGPIAYPGYPARPPLGGDHSALPQQCGVYDEQVPAEHAVHSLEHGAVWVTHRPDLADDDVARLRRLVEGSTHRLLSPLPGQEEPVVLTAWGVQLAVQDADDDRVEAFLEQYTRSPQAPEPAAACTGNRRTGPLPFDPPGADAPQTTDA